jgi:hypothetical protein
MLGRHHVLPFTDLTGWRGKTRRQRARHDMSSPFVRILSRGTLPVLAVRSLAVVAGP